MSRRNGRILAFQALYSWDVSKSSVEELLTFSWVAKTEENEEAKPVEVAASVVEEQTFAGIIVKGTIDHIQEIDEIIKNHLSASWSIERLNKVTLAILRTSIFEMKYINSAASKIIIDEAVGISKKYGSDDSYKFINAVLDKIGNDEKTA